MLNVWADSGDTGYTYSEPSQPSEMYLFFAKMIDSPKLSTFYTKSYISGVWLGS